MESYRFSMQSVRSWANQTLEAETIRTLFGGFATFLGASPDDAGGAELSWVFASVLQNVGNNLVKGGMDRVTLALADHLQAHGGEIRTNCHVEKILGDAKRATAVRLANGEEIPVGQLIVSNVDPGHLVLDLLGAGMVGQEIAGKMQQYEWAILFLSFSLRSTARSTTRQGLLRGNRRMFILPNRRSTSSQESISNVEAALYLWLR